jgi:Nucleoside-diphosphate-sugar epimerases
MDWVVTLSGDVHPLDVTGTVSVLVAAKDCGVPAVVAASSSSVYGDTPGSGVVPVPTHR